MLRYMVPLLILFFVLSGVVLLVGGAGFAASVSIVILFITVLAWPFLVGPHLHETAWRELAALLNLAVVLDGKALRLVGTYRDRELELKTLAAGTGKGSRYVFRLVLPVDAPPNYTMHFRKTSKLDMAVRRLFNKHTHTGNVQFDRRFLYRVFNVNPHSVAQMLSTDDLGDRLTTMVSNPRPVWIVLYNQTLRFEESQSLLLGAEKNSQRLCGIINVMCDLAEAIEALP